MSKHLLLALFLVPACTITINGSGSEGNTTPQNTDPGPGSDPTTDDPSGATTTEVPTTGTATAATTTGETTTVASSEAASTEMPTSEPVATDSTGATGESTAESGSSGDSSETGTGGDSEYGLCGWNVMKTYYACPGDGGVPGLEDPKNNYPIDCREQELAAGAECGQVGLAGCCTAEGNLYYCNEGGLVEQQCGV